jgi:hypothetical protein
MQGRNHRREAFDILDFAVGSCDLEDFYQNRCRPLQEAYRICGSPNAARTAFAEPVVFASWIQRSGTFICVHEHALHLSKANDLMRKSRIDYESI